MFADCWSHYGKTNLSSKESGTSTKESEKTKLLKKQCGGVYFWLYGIAYWMLFQQKLSPPVLLFSDLAGWDLVHFLTDKLVFLLSSTCVFDTTNLECLRNNKQMKNLLMWIHWNCYFLKCAVVRKPIDANHILKKGALFYLNLKKRRNTIFVIS